MEHQDPAGSGFTGCLGAVVGRAAGEILQPGLLCIISGREVDPVLALMAFARSEELDWSAFNAVVWFPFDVAEAKIVNGPEWAGGGLKRGRAGEPVSGMTHPKVWPTYVLEYCETGMRRAYARAVWDRFKATNVDLDKIPSLDGQAAVLRELEEPPAVEVADAVEENDEDLNFDGMVSVDEVAASGLQEKLREIQRLCEESGEAVPVTVVEVVDLARVVVETKRENAAFAEGRAKALTEIEELQGTLRGL